MHLTAVAMACCCPWSGTAMRHALRGQCAGDVRRLTAGKSCAVFVSVKNPLDLALPGSGDDRFQDGQNNDLSGHAQDTTSMCINSAHNLRRAADYKDVRRVYNSLTGIFINRNGGIWVCANREFKIT